MTLVLCKECHREISDQAPACPGCGNPQVEVAGSTRNDGAKTTTQRTAKRLKAHYAVAAVMVLVGAGLLVGGLSEQRDPQPPAAGFILVTVGMLWLLVTKLRIWWHHE